MVDLLLAIACLCALLLLPPAVHVALKASRSGRTEKRPSIPAGRPLQAGANLGHGDAASQTKVEKEDIELAQTTTFFSNVGSIKPIYASTFTESPMTNLVTIGQGTETANPKSTKVVSLDQFRNSGKKTA